MLKISREVELGLLMLVELGRKSRERLSLKEWTDKRDLPYRFMSKVAVKLKKAGLLSSREGRDGGYVLAKSAGKIKVSEVIKALEGPIKPVRCMSGLCECEDFCGHKDLMKGLSKVVEKQLGKTTIKDLV